MTFPDHRATQFQFSDFPVDTRVRVVATFVDWYFFRGDTGVVTSNNGNYLGIMVKFDVPRQIGNKETDPPEWMQTEFNFNPYDLEPIKEQENERTADENHRRDSGRSNQESSAGITDKEVR